MTIFVERRSLARLPLHVCVRFKIHGAVEPGFATTRDVSAGGIYLRTCMDVKIGQELDCILVLPESLTLAPNPVYVSCQGKVLRVESNDSNLQAGIGVAVEISSFDFSSKQDFDFKSECPPTPSSPAKLQA